jgi:PilZ domain
MSSAARYFQRSPRYVLRPGDRSLMRYAGMESKGDATPARVRDLSSTGLSFIVEGENVPFENELLKVEFNIPGDKQVAWFATVMRVETRSEWDPSLGDQTFTLIALRFRPLPPQFQNAIEKSLSGRISPDEEPLTSVNDASALFTLAAATSALLASMLWMCLPLSKWIQLLT